MAQTVTLSADERDLARLLFPKRLPTDPDSDVMYARAKLAAMNATAAVNAAVAIPLRAEPHDITVAQSNDQFTVSINGGTVGEFHDRHEADEIAEKLAACAMESMPDQMGSNGSTSSSTNNLLERATNVYGRINYDQRFVAGMYKSTN